MKIFRIECQIFLILISLILEVYESSLVDTLDNDSLKLIKDNGKISRNIENLSNFALTFANYFENSIFLRHRIRAE